LDKNLALHTSIRLSIHPSKHTFIHPTRHTLIVANNKIRAKFSKLNINR